MHRDHVGMHDSCRCLGFPHKPLDERAVACQIRFEKLNGHVAAELPVVGAVDSTHSAAPDLCPEFVVADRCRLTGIRLVEQLLDKCVHARGQ